MHNATQHYERKEMIEKEEKRILTTMNIIETQLKPGTQEPLKFANAQNRDTWFEDLFTNLETIAKSIEKTTWLQGTRNFSSDPEPNFVTPFDDPFAEGEELVKMGEKKATKLETLLMKVLDVIHIYGKHEKSQSQPESYSLSLTSIGLEIYNIMKRYSLEFERCEPKELSPFLESDCFFTLSQDLMNLLLRYFADIKDQTNTLIILKDMQQLQLGANVETYNTLIRYALYGEDKNQAVKIVKYMKQQGLELHPDTVVLLKTHRLM